MAGSEGQDGETRPGAAYVGIRSAHHSLCDQPAEEQGHGCRRLPAAQVRHFHCGANYREANSAESRDDFIHRTAIVEKEAAETEYWLEVCAGAEIGEAQERHALRQESGELLAIFTSIGRTTRARRSTR
ncbi:MAG TPA: four helix bundle protein [Armatimonadota bacterium]|jgi:hypothetical protein|nr:four helix bundle protein [Armatimonadota bacterium]